MNSLRYSYELLYNCLPFFVANVTVHLVLQLEFALVSSVLVGFGTMSGSYNNFSEDDDDLPFVGWTGKSIGGGLFSLYFHAHPINLGKAGGQAKSQRFPTSRGSY